MLKILKKKNKVKEIQWKLNVSVFSLLIILFLAGWLRIHFVSISMPYPRHADETWITSHAINILKTGDFNPHFFQYPSLPIYLTTVGFSYGFISSASHSKLKKIDDIGSVLFPYYKNPLVVWPAKIIFVAISVLGILFAGLIAYKAYGNYILLFLVPIILSFSNLYFVHSQQYINVDIVGTFFIALLLFYQLKFLSKDSFFHKSIIPGALTGLCIASKYPLVIVAVVSLLVIFLYSKEKKLIKCVLFFLIMCFTFLVCVPYSLLDFKSFLNDIGYQAYHYNRGHSGHTYSSGLSQLIFFIKGIAIDFGVVTSAFAAFGFIALLLKNWKKAIIVVVFPAVLIAQMSMFKPNFQRNLLPVYLFTAIFAGIGFLYFYDLLTKLFSTKIPLKNNVFIKKFAAFIILLALITFSLPIGRAIKWIQTKPDTRNQIVKWIYSNVKKGSHIILPIELGIPDNHLCNDYNIVRLYYLTTPIEKLYKRAQDFENPYIIMPKFGYDKRIKPEESNIKATKANLFVRYLNVITNFPGNDALVNYFYTPSPKGNPEICIGQLKN